MGSRKSEAAINKKWPRGMQDFHRMSNRLVKNLRIFPPEILLNCPWSLATRISSFLVFLSFFFPRFLGKASNGGLASLFGASRLHLEAESLQADRQATHKGQRRVHSTGRFGASSVIGEIN